MFLTFDCVKKGSKRFIVTHVDDSDPKDIRYTCVQDNQDVREVVNNIKRFEYIDVAHVLTERFPTSVTIKASELKFVEAL